MPWKAPKPCKYPGCLELVRDGGYCDKHKKQVNQSNNRNYNRHHRNKSSQAFYDSTQWRKLRKIKIARDPFCEECRNHGLFASATHVDHKVEIRDGGASLDMDNLQSLCHSCHSRKTLLERQKRMRNDG